MNEQRQQAYFNLIQSLLNCRSDDEIQKILAANQDLIDAGLVQKMLQMASNLLRQGELDQANRLMNIAGQQIGVSSKISSTATEKEYLDFLKQVLKVTADSRGNAQLVYPLLEKNTDKLDGVLAEILRRRWGTNRLREAQADVAISIAGDIVNFSTLIAQFPLDNKASNMEIAITGYEVALSVYTQQAFPQYWAMTQYNLGNAYVERITGEKAQNIELAIAAFSAALSVYTQQAFPEYWAMTQNSLGIAYRKRITGEKAQNIELAIAAFSAALSVYTQQAFPEYWAMTQINLGVTYFNRILGEKAQNIELAITAFSDALSVRTQQAFPQDWAMTQYNLGHAYVERITGEKAENIEQAIAAYTAVLSVRTQQAFPQHWARTQNSLGAAYVERITGEKAQNIELAITAFSDALSVRTQQAFPQDWARTQNNLGNAYVERITGEKAQNIELAIAAFSAALSVYTQQAFPQDWARTQNNLGLAYHKRITGEKAQNIELAIASLKNSLSVYSPEAFPSDYAETQFYLGIAYQDVLNFKEAYTALSEAAQKVDYLKGKTTSNSDSQQEKYEIWIILYQRLVEVSLKLGSKSCEAIEYIEASKSIHLRDVLAHQNVYSNPNFNPKGDIPPKVIARLNDLRQKISRENQENSKSSSSVTSSEIILSYIATARNTSTHASTITTTINTSTSASTPVNELIKELETLIKEKIAPIDANFNLHPQVSYNKIQQLLKDSKIVIVEWYFTRKTFVTCIFSEDISSPLILESTDEDFQELIEWSKKYFSDYKDHPQKWRKSLNNRLDELGKIININEIIKIIKDKSANSEQLLLIPHKTLHSLPIHALRLSDNSYLLDKFQNGVRYLPSCGILAQIQNRSFSEFSKLYAIQNPTNDLYFTNIEVKLISNYFQSPETKIFLKNHAKKEIFNNDEIRFYHSMHLACHANFNFQNGLQSALILADAIISPDNIDADSSKYIRIGNWIIDPKKCLSLENILKLELNKCRLVVLSACETAMTHMDSKIEEYLSLPAAFLVAGSIGVVGSLWRVDDCATALLMVKFYEYLLKEENTVSVSLKKAQIWLRDVTIKELKEWTDKLSITPTEKEFLADWFYQIESQGKSLKSPDYWAAFCLVGN